MGSVDCRFNDIINNHRMNFMFCIGINEINWKRMKIHVITLNASSWRYDDASRKRMTKPHKAFHWIPFKAIDSK